MAQCSTRVTPNTPWAAFNQYQCTRRAVVERNGKAYCKRHDPEYIKQKVAEREAKRKAKGCQVCGGKLERWWSYCPSCGTKRVA